ncbi:LuxR C-terminal-related transcriptional regulator [Actinoplanes sp. KI2]|uniref:helix-turn-helix transcriptional regulator n=1 Tax=Actinoplanes sp. KI2 TaxID=2983315 RepID=UPI0021D571CF|nr:LuxR C-terminal-related transcriptional regulator [Actinoplanes sp. KI2]MCU7724450.1 LuxR C-terminal-related transcriptional regulator [Actinoplanes sp. KI2]
MQASAHIPNRFSDLTLSKLLPPPVRAGTVRRQALLEQLVEADPRRIVSVVAPAGYGKTTLLSQWAERHDQAFAWVSVDEADNDPKVLLTYIAEALNAVEPLGPRVFDALASPTSSIPGTVVPRLASAFASMSRPAVLVLDDVHLLDDRTCRDALSVLAENVPDGSRLVLAGRTSPPLRIARLRAEGRVLEIGVAELSLTVAEAGSLLHEAGTTLRSDEVVALYGRTEGWPVGLYLAALCLRAGGSFDRAVASFGGDDLVVSQYIESEFLDRISRRQRQFLTRAAALDRMSGPLCAAVLGVAGAARTLTELAGSNMLLVPLDRRGRWYRYHHLFRDMLRAELERTDPELLTAIRRRAAAWCLDHQRPEEALEYSMAAGDAETAAGLVAQLWLPVYWRGRLETLVRWLAWLERRGVIEKHPMIAVMAGFLHTVTGRPAEAERWASLLNHWQYGQPGWAADPATEAYTATLRAVHCRGGLEQMRADLDEAVHKYALAGIVSPTPAVYRGNACIMAGDPDGADAYFREAVALAEQTKAQEILHAALYSRSMLAISRGEWGLARSLADQALAAARAQRPGSEEILVWTAQARLALHRGDADAARHALAETQRLRPFLSYALPFFATHVSLHLVRLHLALADPAGAKAVLSEIDEVLRHRPHLGVLVEEAEELRAELSADRTAAPASATALTGAELRVLPMLATHLSLSDIGAEMFLSVNTIRAHARSIYRKLGASSRTEAVQCARRLGLLEG